MQGRLSGRVSWVAMEAREEERTEEEEDKRGLRPLLALGLP